MRRGHVAVGSIARCGGTVSKSYRRAASSMMRCMHPRLEGGIEEARYSETRRSSEGE